MIASDEHVGEPDASLLSAQKGHVRMRSNRTVQTLIQAALLVLLAAIAFRKPPPAPKQQDGGGAPAVALPSNAAILQAYNASFQEHPDAGRKAELGPVRVRAISVDGAVARVKLRIEFQWLDDNPDYTDGPLKNAPGQRGDRVAYTEIFTYRRWNTGWEIEGRIEPSDIR